MQGFAKLYPGVKFFQNNEILDEFRPSILKLFKDKIEEEIQLDQERKEKLAASEPGKKKQDKSEFNESAGLSIRGGLGSLGKPSFGRAITRQGSEDSTDAERPTIDETLAQKKQRLFKWNDY